MVLDEAMLFEGRWLCRSCGLVAEHEDDISRSRWIDLGARVGRTVESKQRQYGDAAGRAGAIMRVLYPDGVRPDQYDDALLIVRILDKLSRIAQRGPEGKDLGGESPYMDIAGYGLLGWRKDGAA
jgi:hypothetical protein